jgi:hypothetical protein
MAIEFTVYMGADNVEYLLLMNDGVLQEDLSGVTKVEVVINGESIDSDTAPADTIWWTDQKTVTQKDVDRDASGDLASYLGDTTDVLKLRLGNVSTLTAGKYRNCCLLLYDTLNTDGVVWDDSMKITVKGCL